MIFEKEMIDMENEKERIMRYRKQLTKTHAQNRDIDVISFINVEDETGHLFHLNLIEIFEHSKRSSDWSLDLIFQDDPMQTDIFRGM